MPLYEYKCGSCGNVFEVIQKFSDQPLIVHENCGGVLERLISTSALQFKGSGWYVNDYGKGNSKDPKPKTEGGESKGEKSNGSQAASESSGKSEKSDKSEKSEKSEKSTKSDSSSSTPSTSSKSDSKSDSKKSDSK
jgi:putative FmdB family regulatory protein